jgi:hypothetical protein
MGKQDESYYFDRDLFTVAPQKEITVAQLHGKCVFSDPDAGLYMFYYNEEYFVADTLAPSKLEMAHHLVETKCAINVQKELFDADI